MNSSARILYVSAEAAEDRNGTIARLDAALGGATIEATSPDDCRTMLADDPSAVDAVVWEAEPDERTARAVGELDDDGDPPIPVFLYAASLPPDTVVGDAVEYVQRKNGASVDVLAEALRSRLGLDGSNGGERDQNADESVENAGEAGPGDGTAELSLERPQLDAVVEAANDCILTVDDDSVVRFANPAVEDVFGYEPSELVGDSITRLMSDDLAERHLDAVARYVETGERRLDWSSVRLRGRHRDGHELPIEVSFAEFTADGRHYFTGIVRDRSEQERREAELRRSTTIMETVDDGIYALDAEDRFVSVNDAYLEMTGYSREELLGAPATTVTGDDLAGEVDRIRSSLADDEDVTTIRTDLPTEDGRTVPVEARISRFELDDGEYGRVGVVRDVSERERLEAELSDTLERITDAFFGVDGDWRFTYVNDRAERLLQQTEDELLGESVWEQFPEAVDSPFQENYERAMAEQEAVSFEEYYEPLDTWFEVNAYPSPSGLSVYFRDVTERVEAERELEARLTQQEVIAELGRTALRTDDLDELMEQAARLVADGLDNDYCKVLDLDPEADELLLRQGVGWHEGIAGSATVANDERSQAGYTLMSEEPIVVEDLTTEERFQGPELLTAHDVKSGISTIIGPYEEPWGILGTHDTERKSFTEHDVTFVQSVANLIWTAIEREALESTLRHERDLNRLVIDTAPVGIVVLDDDGNVTMVNERAAEIAGVSRDRLVEGGLGLTFFDDEGDELPQEELPFTRVQEHHESVYDVDLGVVRPDGERLWLSVNGSTLSAGGEAEPLSVFSVEDVTETRNRTERLASLNEGLGRLPGAESPAEVSDTVVETATDALGFARSYVALYDDEDGVLRTAALSDEASSVVDSALLTDAENSPVWTAFVRDELRVVDDFAAEFDDSSGIGSAVVVPLGTHGVFVAVEPEADAFGETDVLLAEMLGSSARASFDRAAREADLRTHRDDLEEKNERLDRLNRVNRAIRDITQVLLQADSHESIEALVCERLVDIDPYTFAWIGHPDRTGNEVVAAASAGAGDGYLDQVSIPLDQSEQVGPIARAIETGEPQVQNDILSDAAFEPWREEALDRGFRSCATVPLQHRENLHGVITIYADKPNVFNAMETAVLDELGETIGYAMNALDRKRALVSESSTELKFDVPTADAPLFGFLQGTSGRFSLESTVHRLDGYTHLFFRAQGVDAETIREEVPQASDVERVHVVSESEDGCLFECTVRESEFISDLLERGALLAGVDVSEHRATITVRIPTSADARSFVTYFQETFGDVTLLARREVDEPVMSREQFENEIRTQLTERQQEVIRTAYFSGFFEWPRESNGQDVAEILGVTQPTVNRHIRAGERTLFGLLFGERDTPDLS